MQTVETTQHHFVNALYDQAARMLIQEQRTDVEVIDSLVQKGIDGETASKIVFDMQGQISGLKKERARKDMLYGALWCVGGVVATAAGIGFIFWGAIIFGGIQFFKGVVNYMH
jgi:DNA-dependent RNA polymerase auxiliary subunit epsilon